MRFGQVIDDTEFDLETIAQTLAGRFCSPTRVEFQSVLGKKATIAQIDGLINLEFRAYFRDGEFTLRAPKLAAPGDLLPSFSAGVPSRCSSKKRRRAQRPTHLPRRHHQKCAAPCGAGPSTMRTRRRHSPSLSGRRRLISGSRPVATHSFSLVRRAPASALETRERRPYSAPSYGKQPSQSPQLMIAGTTASPSSFTAWRTCSSR